MRWWNEEMDDYPDEGEENENPEETKPDTFPDDLNEIGEEKAVEAELRELDEDEKHGEGSDMEDNYGDEDKLDEGIENPEEVVEQDEECSPESHRKIRL